MARVLRETPRLAPGSRVIYSDLNAILLGELVGRAWRAKPARRLRRAGVFTPLGLQR